MTDQESTRYDVFISYAHADADTDERKAVVESIKDSIEEALKEVLPRRWESWSKKIDQSISNAYANAKTPQSKETVESIKASWEDVKKEVDGKPQPFSILDSETLKWWEDWEQKVHHCISFNRLPDGDKELVAPIKASVEEMLQRILPPRKAFLDSEALKFGDEWNAKIHSCIGRCRVFVYLLSPNYLCSDYCQREKLWWAQEETKKGRLHRATQSVYYVCLPDGKDPNVNVDPKITAYKDENMIVQTDDKPFFESLDEIKQKIVKDRIQTVSKRITDQVVSEDNSIDSYCSVYPEISKYFVGRVKELADLNDRCCNGRAIPVISGYAGIGKSELAVAYAYAYAENFPQGRFLVP
ncbi:MAG: toll/interleukin-1 receptor domain-containing protein, partial [Lentisphaeria bacterium]|nr:toll/interleukin-1 receptor domain-containing protein [Lentisphaeria bacterium]